MKKIIALLLALAMVFCLAACGTKEEAAPAATTETTTTETTEAAPAAAEEEAKTYQFGFGISVSTSITDATEDADASVQVNPTVAVILVDEEGKIAACKLDVAQSSATVSADGEVLDKEQAYKTKLEKGDEYGMAKASSLEKGEWYQQAAYFCEYAVGKTLADIQGIELDESYYPADADLTAGCTIHVSDFMNAIADAYDRLVDAGEATEITLGINTDITGSTDLSADADGQVFFANYYGAAALDKDGKITAAVIDETQLKFPVTEGGVIGETSNTLSKIQLKENYGMQKASTLEKGEWYQQSEYLCGQLVGLDKAGVEAIAMDDTTHATDADILAGCTMKIGDMIECLVKGM